MSMSFKASPDGTYGEILVNGHAVAKLPVTGNAVIPGLVGTVSQSGGIPTGAVVERGSNANGEYVRFADGTQICNVAVPTATYAITTGSGAVFRTALHSVPLPATFSMDYPPASSVDCSAADGRVWGGVSSVTGGSQANWLAFAGLSIASVNERFSITVVGRWF